VSGRTVPAYGSLWQPVRGGLGRRNPGVEVPVVGPDRGSSWQRVAGCGGLGCLDSLFL